MSTWEQSPWLTVNQVATYTGHHRDTVIHALHDGELRGRQRTAPRGHWRIHIDEVDAWMGGERPPQRRHLRSA